MSTQETNMLSRFDAQLPQLPTSENYKDQALHVEGGTPLVGIIEQVGGAKNAGYKGMIASCLIDTASVFHNMPVLGDVDTTANILKSLGATVHFSEDRKIVSVDPQGITNYIVPREYGEVSRASILTAGFLLHRFGRAVLPLPGGDDLGDRPVDIHLAGLEALGATYEEITDEEGKRLILTAENGLRGANFRLKVPSHMATENLIIAATKAKGKTILQNCAQEPEVDWLIDYLRKTGAQIDVTNNEYAERVITIEGVDELHGVEHTIMPDRNAVVTYAVAALITNSEDDNGVIVKLGSEFKKDHIQSFLDLLDEMNGGYEIQDDGVRFFVKEGGLKAPEKPIITAPHPGFMTDWQALVAPLLMKAEGTSTIIEAMYSKRFSHLEKAGKHGAHVEFFDPQALDSTIKYYFPQKAEDQSPHGARITGGKELTPFDLEMSDVRSGAFYTLVALMSEKGKSVLKDTTQIQRGYHMLVENLQKIGASIVVEK